MQQMIRHYGIGPLVPNTVVFGGTGKNKEQFATVITEAHEKNYNIILFRDAINSSEQASFSSKARLIDAVNPIIVLVPHAVLTLSWYSVSFFK